MSKKVISIDNATIDAEKLRGYNSEALQALDAKVEAEAEFKDIVERAATETKLKKGVISAFFKARHADKAKDVVKKGEVFGALASALDD